MKALNTKKIVSIVTMSAILIMIIFATPINKAAWNYTIPNADRETIMALENKYSDRPGIVNGISSLICVYEWAGPDAFMVSLADITNRAATERYKQALNEFVQVMYNWGALNGYEARLSELGYNVGNATTTAAATTKVADTKTSTSALSKVVFAKEDAPFLDKPAATGKTIGTIPKSAPITVTGLTSDGWYELLFADGGKAYSPAGFYSDTQ